MRRLRGMLAAALVAFAAAVWLVVVQMGEDATGGLVAGLVTVAAVLVGGGLLRLVRRRPA